MALDAAALLAKLTDKASEIAPEAASKGFDKLLEEGHGLTEGLDGEALEGAKAVLEELEANKQPFMRLSAEGFAFILGHFGNDDEEAAKNHYIATQATYAERRAWMQEGGDLAVKDKEERIESWEAVKVVLKKVVLKGLPFALKLAANALGLPI